MSNISEEDKLSWGDVDFIEESASFCNEPLDFQELDESVICEAETKKSPFKIIGKLVGKFAPVGGFSRNNRYYPESHWKGVLESAEVQRRLKGREMLGMIGHEDSRVGDNQIRSGLISHIVSCLEIREDKNGKPFLYGEMDILDTPAGRILKAMHEGGAGLYVSSRAAGKLLDTPGKPYKTVAPQFFLETWDVVARPGFMEAKPVFEATPSETQVSESTSEPEEQSNLKENLQPQQSSESNTIAELNNKINQLTKIIEKVVDDVYEEDNQPTQSIEEQLGDLLLNPSVSEEAFEDVVSILKESKPELINSIMENSRKKFNAEHGDKSGLEIEYYRFAGKHPYKIVPKGTDYFAASHDAPTYRSLKQAQKHVLDNYNKPKEEKVEEAKCEKKANKKSAIPAFIKIMAESNITEEAFSEILDMLKGDLQ